MWGDVAGGGLSGRVLKEVELGEPIRYASNDHVERWLNELLCLDAPKHIPRIINRSFLSTWTNLIPRLNKR